MAPLNCTPFPTKAMISPSFPALVSPGGFGVPFSSFFHVMLLWMDHEQIWCGILGRSAVLPGSVSVLFRRRTKPGMEEESLFRTAAEYRGTKSDAEPAGQST